MDNTSKENYSIIFTSLNQYRKNTDYANTFEAIEQTEFIKEQIEALSISDTDEIEDSPSQYTRT